MWQWSVCVPRPKWQHGRKTSCLDGRYTLRDGIASELRLKLSAKAPCNFLKGNSQIAISDQASVRAIQERLSLGLACLGGNRFDQAQ